MSNGRKSKRAKAARRARRAAQSTAAATPQVAAEETASDGVKSADDSPHSSDDLVGGVDTSVSEPPSEDATDDVVADEDDAAAEDDVPADGTTDRAPGSEEPADEAPLDVDDSDGQAVEPADEAPLVVDGSDGQAVELADEADDTVAATRAPEADDNGATGDESGRDQEAAEPAPLHGDAEPDDAAASDNDAVVTDANDVAEDTPAPSDGSGDRADGVDHTPTGSAEPAECETAEDVERGHTEGREGDAAPAAALTVPESAAGLALADSGSAVTEDSGASVTERVDAQNEKVDAETGTDRAESESVSESDSDSVRPEPRGGDSEVSSRTEEVGAPATAAQTEDDDTEKAAPAAAAAKASPRRSWQRLGMAARPRPTKANVLATLLALGLGFAIAAQVHQTSIEGLEDLREDELIRILDTVNQDGDRLADELQTLRFSRDRLQNDTTSLTEQRDAAQQRLDSLGILSGTVAAKGPGIILTIEDPRYGVTAPLLLDTLQELRDAGAEAVEINGNRIVANSFFTDTEGGIEISGNAVKAPYVVRAIGDPATLAPAMDIPGGVSESVRTLGGKARIESRDEVRVTALRTVSTPQYARPVPSPTKS